MPREKFVTIRFRATPKDKRKLERLARHFDRSASYVLRRLIDEASERARAVPTDGE